MKSCILKALWCVSSLLAAACVTEEKHEEVLLHIGDTMPQFEVTTLSGETYSPQRLRGHESVIVFFNTECTDCRRELPDIQRQADSEPEVIYLCIAREEGAESIAAFWQEHELTMPVSAQSDRRIYSLFAHIGIPRTFRFTPTLQLIEM